MFNRLRFHNQLILIFSLGIIVLALVTAFVVTDVSKDAVRERIFDESLSLVENLAEQSTLSLLYQSPDSAKDVTNIFSDFPDVSGIEILNKDLTKLYGYGETHITNVSINLINEKPRLIFESKDAWVFSAPVLTQKNNDTGKSGEVDYFSPPDASVFELGSESSKDDVKIAVNTTEIIGYVQLLISKKSLEKISFDIFKYNIFVSLVLAIFLLTILLFITQRITRPMAKLSETMRVAQSGELLVRADMDGPRDIFEIKKAFNAMMDQLERREKQIKQARDEAYESAAEKARFAANVSHELRTPMNGVLGMLDLLPENGLTQTQLEYVRIAKKSAQSLLSLIDDVLDFSKNESLSIMLESKSFNIVELLDELTALLGLKAQTKHIDFCYEVQSDVPTILEGDVEKIRQVLINLMGNAIKFTLTGTVSVVVKKNIDMCSKEKGKIPISFSVSDTGVGVSEEAKDKIFDAFVQVDNSPSRQFGGTGLGLAISRQLVDILDGDLSVSSEEGVGSEFSFTIPLTPVSTLSHDEHEFIVKTCLIVTGNPIFARSLKVMLNNIIEKIWIVDDASDALQFVSASESNLVPLDLIILDDNVHKDFDFFCTIKNQQLLANVALVLAGYEASQLSERVFQPDIFLTKPIMRTNLFGFIRDRFSSKDASAKENNVIKIQPQDNSKINGKRILVVEDIDTNWLVTKGMLNTMGCNADIARNGKEGVEKIKNGSYDLILMDCHMPIMDGYSATNIIRKMEKNTDEHNVIIAMTANNLSGEKEKCFAAGMDDFLSKPLSRIDLKNVLFHWLGQEKVNKKPVIKSHINKKIKVPPPPDVVIPDNVVDGSKMMELKSQMGDAMPTLVASFVSHMEEHIANLSVALKENDTRKIKFIAHAIKGSASNFGAARLVDKSKELESHAEHLSLTESEEAIRVVAHEGRLVVDYLRNI